MPISPPPNKEYLGDSVYVESVDGETIKLTTENGVSVSNTIHLEPHVWKKLVRWVEGD